MITVYNKSGEAKAFRKLLSAKRRQQVVLRGLVASAPAVFFADTYGAMTSDVLFILNDDEEAQYVYNDLRHLLDDRRVLYLPSSYRREVRYAQRDAANEVMRTETLAAISGDSETHHYIVTCPRAVAELVVSKRQLDSNTVVLKVGQTIDMSLLAQRLRELGFHETDYVYEPGQFALRGSIIDIYSFSSEQPFRIDFFGDEIDTIRTFEVESQLSVERRNQVEVVPQMAIGRQERESLLSFLSSDTVLVAHDYRYVAETIGRVYEEGISQQAITERLAEVPEVEREEIRRTLDRDVLLLKRSQWESGAKAFRQVVLLPAEGATDADDNAVITFHTSPQPPMHKNFDLLRQTLADYVSAGIQVNILSDSDKQLRRIREILHPDKEEQAVERYVTGTIHGGFVDYDHRVVFLTDHQIFERFHKVNMRGDKARTGKAALTMKELQEMDPGDFIVHVDFGIGKFGGLVRVPEGNSMQEKIRIIYQHNDIVDVSIHSLYKISKYRSQETGEPPRLSILGTGAWQRLKERTKKKIKDIARDLIRLYAKRRSEKGYAFSGDTYLQQALEASFLYEDTPDQLKATQEVKADMESQRPMDRLVCGDVGFGKTEVAIRAAFKAATDGKQVAVLVPTTVLAFQHYQTFKERLEGMPVTVEYLSRARSAKKVREVTEAIANGKADIIIGTHKLTGKNIQWKDLGLLIIDEEQKFGVAVKERLRKMKTNVDTLTMSATPIPRTLQFSLLGARDMSIIRTPPPNRYPIQTIIGSLDGDIVADAIGFEMSRNGQVFFVNSRIAQLTEIEKMIKRRVPDARVAIGHGQMPPEQLEKIIMGFINYDYDVLLSTTIVENGVDIPNANTIIINDAHRFGLSDLHQMRGRVGRSNKKAFCYLLAPPLSAINAEARRRLESLETFSDLGSGFSLAMQDLDIRGAGNLLGAEQSGFMEDLGYETYQKILTQAVTELKNDEFRDLFRDEIAKGMQIKGDEFVDDCSLESDLEMYFPESYVPTDSERILLYRELDNITSEYDLEAYRKRMEDRFGKVPPQGEELMNVVMLRKYGREMGVEKMILKQGRMQLQLVSNAESPYFQSDAFGRLISYVMANPRRCNFKQLPGKHIILISDVSSTATALDIMKSMN